MNTKLQKIGEGLFSKVYRLNDKQVLIKSICQVKECIAMDWHQSTGVFPVLERTDEQGEYICEYYERVKSLKDSLTPAHYEIYKDLRSLKIDMPKNTYDLMDCWRAEFKKVKNKKYRDALLNMTDNLANYGSQLKFEISPRNVAVKNGKLILLDVFFFHDQMLAQRSKPKKIYSY